MTAFPHRANPYIPQRLAAYQKGGDPRDLWPGIGAAEFETARAAIVRATRTLLTTPHTITDLEADVPARALGVAAFATGMGPLLGWWIERGRLRATNDVANVLAMHLDHGRRRAALLDAQLHIVLGALEERGIHVTLLKGMHTGWQYFPEPGTRPMSDIDVLVPPEAFARAREALSDSGLVETNPRGLPFRTEYRRAEGNRLPPSLEVDHAENPWAIDLHCSLDRMVIPGITARLGLPPAPVRIGRAGRSVHVVAQPFLLAALAFHGSCHFGALRLVALVELVLVIRRDFSDDPDRWTEMLALVEDRGIERSVYPALALSNRLCPGVVPSRVLERIAAGAPRLMRRVMKRASPEAGQQLYRRYADTRLMWIGSPREAWNVLTRRVRPLRLLRDFRARRLRLTVPPGVPE